MLTISIIAPFTILALIILFFIATRVGSGENKGDETLMKNVYVYLVLFATLMMVIGGSVGAFMSVADIVSPAPYHQSFEEYRQWGPDYDSEKVEKKTEAELRESYEEMIRNDQEQSTKRAINTLIKSFGWIVIPLPIFIYFQRRLTKKE